LLPLVDRLVHLLGEHAPIEDIEALQLLVDLVREEQHHQALGDDNGSGPVPG